MHHFFSRHWQTIYFIFALVFIVAATMRPFPYSWLLKIIPISLLLGHLLMSDTWAFPKTLKFGVILSLVGDFILDFYSDAAFIFGLGAFFIAHVFYIASFAPWKYNRFAMSIALLALTYGAFIMSLMVNNLAELTLPVFLYMAILYAMTCSALFSTKNNLWLSLGALSFLLSDSFIGINQFYWSFQYSGIAIMSSYYFAQYAIVKGLTSVE